MEARKLGTARVRGSLGEPAAHATRRQWLTTREVAAHDDRSWGGAGPRETEGSGDDGEMEAAVMEKWGRRRVLR
jgi:hypothetical protein